MRRLDLQRSILVAGLLCGAAWLAACNGAASPPAPPLAALPPTTAAPLLIPAPALGQLPPAPPPPLLQASYAGDDYAFAERAYAMDTAFADSPPDYDFDDDGASPWVWVADDGSECVAEFTPDGWRYYYYDPNADQPFFIEDPQYGYGFENGGLVVIYDHYGREAPAGSYPAQDEIAGQYLARATVLRQAAAHDPHRAVAAADWESHRDVISAQRQSWAQAAAAVPAWQAYHAQHAAADDAHWSGEQLRREAWAARVDASLGDQGRSQAEWRAAQSTAQAAGGASPAWSGWRAPPPQLATAGPASQSPAALAHNDTPAAADRPGYASHGLFAPTAAAPRGPALASAVPHSRTVPVAQPRTEHAVAAETFATPASARAPLTHVSQPPRAAAYRTNVTRPAASFQARAPAGGPPRVQQRAAPAKAAPPPGDPRRRG